MIDGEQSFSFSQQRNISVAVRSFAVENSKNIFTFLNHIKMNRGPAFDSESSRKKCTVRIFAENIKNFTKRLVRSLLPDAESINADFISVTNKPRHVFQIYNGGFGRIPVKNNNPRDAVAGFLSRGADCLSALGPAVVSKIDS